MAEGRRRPSILTPLHQPPPSPASLTSSPPLLFPPSTRCWGRKFDEDLSLSSLRVLPPYSAVPRWRAALALGSPLESLSATWLGNPPEAKEVHTHMLEIHRCRYAG